MLQADALSALKTMLSKDQVFTDRAALIAYEVDAGLDKGMPEGVVFPRTIKEVERLMRWAAEHRIPLVARGAGTGLSGGAVADRGGVVVDFSHMNKVLGIDVYGRRVTVQASTTNLKLEDQVDAQGMYFPPDPASQRASTIGGNVAENSGGPHCFKYGVTTNYVTGLSTVLADGHSIRVGGQALDYPEYDLCGLLTGSEGTLGLITEISLRLVPKPPAVRTMLAVFDSIEQAGVAVSAIIASGLVPATLELMDQKIIRIVEPYAHANLPLNAGAILVIDIDGYAESLDTQTDEITRILQAHEVHQMRISNNEEERARIWLARKSVAGAITRLTPSYQTVDITVPRSRLAEILVDVEQICQRNNLRVGYLAHAGDGNLHPMVLIPDKNDPDLMKRVHHGSWEMVKCSVEMQGSLTGEHGVGIEKRDFMSLMHNSDELMAMWDVKQAFDPDTILNPGKIFPSPTDETTPFAGYQLPPLYRSDAPEAIDVPDKEIFAPGSVEEAAQGLLVLSRAGRSVQIMGASLSVDLAAAAVVISSTGQSFEIAEAAARVAQPAATQAQPTIKKHAGTLLSTRLLNGIKTYAPDDLYITVGAGTPFADIQAFLAKDRKQVPLSSPWPNATIGGLISANINSPQRMRYGAIRDLVLGGTAALADGRVIRIGRPIVKNVAGYDMPKLFVGSYGTVGLLADVILKLVVQPRARHTLLVPVEDMRYGLIWARKLLPHSLIASAIVLCKGFTTANEATNGALSAPYLLAYTAEGIAEDVQAELQQVRATLQEEGAPTPTETEALSGTSIWADMLGAVTDDELLLRAGLPVKDLPAYLQDQASILNEASTRFIADIANGFVYASNNANSSDKHAGWVNALRTPALAREGYAIVMSMPESLDGSLDRWGYQPQGLELMRRLKARWDPSGILNPGTFF